MSQAAAGRFAEAIATLDAALALVPAEAAERRARLLERRALFAAGRPYVEAPRRWRPGYSTVTLLARLRG